MPRRDNSLFGSVTAELLRPDFDAFDKACRDGGFTRSEVLRMLVRWYIRIYSKFPEEITPEQLRKQIDEVRP